MYVGDIMYEHYRVELSQATSLSSSIKIIVLSVILKGVPKYSKVQQV